MNRFNPRTVIIQVQFANPVNSSLRYRLMKILLSYPVREMEMKGPKSARNVLKELGLIPEGYLIIRGSDLMTEDEILGDGDTIEIRPVISGG